MNLPPFNAQTLDRRDGYYESNTMNKNIPFTIKIPISLKRDILRLAKARNASPSATARAFLEEGVAREKPGALLGAGKGTAHFAADYDPSEPAFPLGDWGEPQP